LTNDVNNLKRKRNMKKVLASAALALAAFAAAATPVVGNLTLEGYQYGSAPVGTVTVNPSGLFNNHSTTLGVSGLSGTFTTSNDPIGDSFTLWCLEVFAPTANFGEAASYTQNTPGLAGYSTAFTASQTSRLTNLFAKEMSAYGAIGGTSVLQSAATQLAVWEILYDTTSGFGDLTGNLLEQAGLKDTNGFWAGSLAGARTEAESLLAGIDSYNGSAWNITMNSLNNGGSKTGLQDFLYVSVSAGCSEVTCGPVTNVPEPGSVALLGAGLMAVGFVHRRRKTK
jgi:hypothetical protein